MSREKNVDIILSQYLSLNVSKFTFVKYISQIFNYYTSLHGQGILSNEAFNTLFSIIPTTISNLIYNLFNVNRTQLLLQDFTRGMTNLYYSSLPKKIKFVFDLFDTNGDGKISKRDICQILYYFHLFYNRGDIKEIDEIVNISFDFNSNIDEDELNLEDFFKILTKNTSDIFIFVMIHFFKYKPFNEENINYCWSVSDKTKVHGDYERVNEKEEKTSLQKRIFEFDFELKECSKTFFEYIKKYIDTKIEFESRLTSRRNSVTSATESSDNELEGFISDLNNFEKDAQQLIQNFNDNTENELIFKSIKRRFQTKTVSFANSLFPKSPKGIIKNNSPDFLSQTIVKQFPTSVVRREKKKFETVIISEAFVNRLRKKKNSLVSLGNANLINKKIKLNVYDVNVKPNLLERAFQREETLVLLNKQLFLLRGSKESHDTLKKIIILNHSFIRYQENFYLQELKTVLFKLEITTWIDFKKYTHIFYCKDGYQGKSFAKILKLTIHELKDSKIRKDYEIIRNKKAKGTYYELVTALDHQNDMKYVSMIIYEKDKLSQMKKIYADLVINQIIIYKEILQSLHQSCKGFVKVLDVLETNQYIYVIKSDNNGEGEEMIKSMSILDRQYSILQICQVLNTLHKLKIVHRDITSRNFTFKKNKSGNIRISLSSFNFCYIKHCTQFIPIDNNDILQELITKDYYMEKQFYLSQEIIKGKREKSYSCDIWSFAVLSYYLLYETYPFFTENLLNSDEIPFPNLKDKIEPNQQNKINEIIQVIKDCFMLGERIKIKDIMKKLIPD